MKKLVVALSIALAAVTFGLVVATASASSTHHTAKQAPHYTIAQAAQRLGPQACDAIAPYAGWGGITPVVDLHCNIGDGVDISQYANREQVSYTIEQAATLGCQSVNSTGGNVAPYYIHSGDVLAVALTASTSRQVKWAMGGNAGITVVNCY